MFKGEQISVSYYELNNKSRAQDTLANLGVKAEKAKGLIENIRQGKGNILLQVFTLNEHLFKSNLKYSDIGTSMIEIQRIVDTKVPKIDNPKVFFDSCKRVV
ncbi:MAG: hypothetical protein PHF46_03340 [Candidatus Gracilibacteria bacterium]|nr:hypothetical protein [Candidatus Gracilibacteria bacterium]MDD4530520.1 hypothetical protein [Candidatus Gracilibacteria bacterium]